MQHHTLVSAQRHVCKARFCVGVDAPAALDIVADDALLRKVLEDPPGELHTGLRMRARARIQIPFTWLCGCTYAPGSKALVTLSKCLGGDGKGKSVCSRAHEYAAAQAGGARRVPNAADGCRCHCR